MAIEILIPPIIKVGGGAFAEASSILKRLEVKHPLIVTDAFLVRLGLAESLRTQIENAGIACGVFSETVADPTTDAVTVGLRAFTEGRQDGLVSLGGGSPIDSAKAIGMLAANGGCARDYKVPNEIPKKGPVHLAIPTTAGTGSEVSRFTVITDSETDEKMLIAGASLVPNAAIVDYELTMSMPARLTADTGTDSLTHAIEAYVSRKANAFADAFAMTAMKAIWAELPIAFREPGNRRARESHDAGCNSGRYGLLECKRCPGSWNEPADWSSFPRAPWTFKRNAAAGGHCVFSASCRTALRGMRASYWSCGSIGL